jgi:CspA family cold shock protein
MPRWNEEIRRMPTGRVKFYDEEKGFGFIASDDGSEVFLHASALPAGAVVRSGTRLEFGVAEGKKGAQALSVRVLDSPTSLSKLNRRSADDMAIVIEDLVKLLDGIGAGLRRGRYPDRAHGSKIAAVLRKVADDLDS